MSESQAIADIEKALDRLPDDARQRVLSWACAKFAKPAVKTAPFEWPKSLPPTWAPPVYKVAEPRKVCAFDNLSPGVYGLSCHCPKCSVQCQGRIPPAGSVWIGDSTGAMSTIGADTVFKTPLS